MTDFDEADCLAVDPFDGDFGSPGDTIFRDKIVIPRKTHECACCMRLTDVGTKTRVITALFDGELHQYRYCTHCCAAMAISEKDGGRAWAKRTNLRNQHA